MVALRRRFPVILFVAVAAISALLAAAVTGIVRSRPLWREEAALRTEAAALAAAISAGAEKDPTMRYDPYGALQSAVLAKVGNDTAVLDLRSSGRRVKVTDGEGGVFFDSTPPGGAAGPGGSGGEALLTVSMPVMVGDAPRGVISLSRESPDGAAGDRRVEQMLVGTVAAAGAAAFLLILFAFFRATVPLAALIGYSRAVEEGREIEPPDLSGDELAAVVNQLEDGRKNLDGTQYVAKYVQTLTHEMKSPLSVLRGAAELLEEEMEPEQRATFIGNIGKETERIQDLVDRLLQLSAIEGRRELRDVESIPLAALIREVAEGMKPFLASKEITPDFDLEEPTAVWGERFLLRQAIANILKNAIEFSPMGGAVALRLRSEDGQAGITVDDTGPGIPDYALERVFEKFYSLARPDTGRRSSGLGLPFARETAILHGGDVTVENLAGGGVSVRLTIPLEPPSAV